MENTHSANSKTTAIMVMIVLAALARLIPHTDNFTPIGAMALFGGTFLPDKKRALIIPLIAMLLSDILLQLFYGNGFHSTLPFVYGSFILIGMLGFVLRKRVQRQTIMVSSLVGSMIFFFVTNFGVWAIQNIYPHTISGLVNCYIAGIPFFRGTVMGDLFYNLVLFGGYSILKWRFPAFAR